MTRPLVMHVIPNLVTGGAEHMLMSLVTASRPQSYPQTVVSLTGGGIFAEPIRNAGVPIYEIGLTHFNLPLAVIRLASLIRKLSPATIQSWLYYGDLLATLALYLSGRRRQTQLYWGVRCSDMSQELDVQLRLAVAACVKLSRLPDAVVANSYSGRQDHQRIGYKPPAFAVIANGIDTGRFRPDGVARARIRAEFGISDTTPLVLHVARVHPMKDHAAFLQVAAAMPEINFAAVGRGTEGLRAPTNVTRLGIRQDMPAIYAAADALLSTSLFGEGFSNAIAEAMAAGVPSVATDVGDSRDIVGDTGLIVPPASVAAMVQALRKITNEPAAQREERARTCRVRIETKFSLAGAVAKFDALYTATGLEALSAIQGGDVGTAV